MIYIGIDQSIKFTGITIYRPGAPTESIFYGITYIKHTKWDKFKENLLVNRLTILDYEKSEKTGDYIVDERRKYYNLKAIVNHIDDLINKLKKSFPNDVIEVRMEGVSFGSKQTTAIADLAGLNYLIRDICSRNNIIFTILPPTKVKKFATGNGQADKELMTESFLVLNPDMRKVHDVIKLDDIADSFFMATYQE